ncbi:hypothetical protein FRP1_29610 (plasmid) [Pseudonocardia sp. EC080625-04]|uniref:TetR/AcrR family transcriptional regulator n=1 Tax=unclassified Pseudonocardia TaxID=2619320 RepID=UPI0006CB5978|nr:MULTISPECIES: TetR/AcrR family transcriptional regulator [unclassified Pseudonocardia]ALE76911.1 hypothetical protein FRP1_29610 [Pseudonocardia sp. EC080625-04]ALL85889.1 hypothetical protein AD017_32815 [Pseudonocardia sp. EC080619-01]
MTKKPRRSKQLRFEEIIEAAAKVFAANGFAEATISQIAAEMDMTGAALYYYVKSKDELLYLVWQRAGARLQKMINAVMRTSQSPEEKLRQAFREHLTVITSDKAIYEVLILHRNRLPEYGRDKMLEEERLYVHTWADLLQQVPDAPLTIEHPRMAAIAINSTLNAVIRWYDPARSPTLDEIADFYCSLFVQGIKETRYQ